MPFDIDCDDADYRAHFSPEQLDALERRRQPALPASPVSLAPKPVVRLVGADRARLEQRRERAK